jgi:hypothetical protein
MIAAVDLLECLKAMTEQERREAVSLLIPALANIPDFTYLRGLSEVQLNQILISQEAIFPGYLKKEPLGIEPDLNSFLRDQSS